MRALLSTASLSVLLGVGALTAAVPTASQAYIGVGISVNFAPPPLPYYEQPAIPGYGYIWTPGYWAWDGDQEDYFWVPGAWVLPPRIGYLWTPGWWGWNNGSYLFNAGYWGPHIGYYGGINYGFGYNGFGFFGGEWRGRDFYYNRSVNNFRNVNITNVYQRNVTNYTTINRVSYSGGRGGVQAQATPEQLQAARESHVGFTPVQQQHVQLARSQPAQRASFNHGAPPVAATARPANFSGPGVVAARGASGVRPQALEGQWSGRPAGSFTNNARPGAEGPNGYSGQPRPRDAAAFQQPQGDQPNHSGYPGGYHGQGGPRDNGSTPGRPAFSQDRQNYDRRPVESRPAQNGPGGGPRQPFARPAPQAQFARPAPPAQQPHPAPQQRQAPPREEHPHDDHR